MSTISTTAARSDSASVGTLQAIAAAFMRWWLARMARRLEKLAIVQLRTMSDRELKDIGLVPSQIEFAVRGECDRVLSRWF